MNAMISRQRILLLSVVAVAALLGGIWLLAPSQLHAVETGAAIPPPALDETAGAGTESIVLAGGCFWGVQGVFQHVKGVVSAVSGYSGGEAKTAHYYVVGSGTTGHAESVKVTFDPHQISYGRILQIYFSVAHDPTELNRQGPDYGTQYRSAIFTDNADQARIAEHYIAQLNQAGAFDAPIVTTVSQLNGFYPAEDYHQNYLTLHPNYPYILINDLPKVRNLQHSYPDLYRDDPVLVVASGASN